MMIRRTVLLVALVANLCQPAPATEIVIAQVGDAAITTGTPKSADLAPFYVVNQRAEVRGTVVGLFPAGAHLFPAVRREGDRTWNIQPPAHKRTQEWSRWSAEVQFGTQAGRSNHFELKMILSYNALPPGPAPPDVLARNTIISSAIVHITRRVSNPVIWIPSIDGQVVQQSDNEVLNVGYESAIEIAARDLPTPTAEGRAIIGVAVQPINPWSDGHWVMTDTLDIERGFITGHFGIRRLHNYHQFRVTAFLTYKLPPIGVPIASEDWQRHSTEFLAQSKPVSVWLWYGETRISHVDGVSVVPGAVIISDPQAEVRGTVQRPLNRQNEKPEKIWLIAVPRGLEPWVTGWAVTLQGGGRWAINTAQLWRARHSTLFDLVAVVSSDDATKISPRDLRQWINDAQERSTERVRVRVSPTISTSGGSR